MLSYCTNYKNSSRVSFSILIKQHSDTKELDLQFSLEDLEAIKVIGKGSGGVVQLVRHKWVGTLFALKVIILPTHISSPCLVSFCSAFINNSLRFEILLRV